MTIIQKNRAEIFTIISNEIVGRIDPYYYKPEFKELESKLKNSKWEIRELYEIATLQYGLGEEAKDIGQIPYLRITDIDENGNLIKQNLKFLFEKKEFEGYVLKKKDILVARIGATFGKTIYFNEEEKFYFAGYLIRINLDKNLISPKYYFYFCQTSIYWKLANKLVSGGGQPQFNANTISNLKIPIPPKDIQEKIISIMDSAYFLKKEAEKKAKDLIESIDDFVLEKLGIEIPNLEEEMTFFVFSNELENNRIDSEFHQKKYKQINKALESGRYEVKEVRELIEYVKKGIEVGSQEYLEVGKKFLRVADFDNFGIYENKLKYISDKLFEVNKDFQPEKEEILFSKDGTIGLCKVLEYNFDGIISSGILRIKVKENINNYFLSYLLKNKYMTSLFENLSIGQIIKHLNIENILNLKIPIPPLPIQKEIAEEVKKRLEKAKKLKQEANENLEKAKKEVEDILLQPK